jgi:hypothetical protein
MWRTLNLLTTPQAFAWLRAQEKQSDRPPTRCRSEWQPSVYPVSSTTLTSITSVPSPMPNRPSQKKACPTSYQSRRSARTARYMKYRWRFWTRNGIFVSPQ